MEGADLWGDREKEFEMRFGLVGVVGALDGALTVGCGGGGCFEARFGANEFCKFGNLGTGGR